MTHIKKPKLGGLRGLKAPPRVRVEPQAQKIEVSKKYIEGVYIDWAFKTGDISEERREIATGILMRISGLLEFGYGPEDHPKDFLEMVEEYQISLHTEQNPDSE